jgi:hypothetical protein
MTKRSLDTADRGWFSVTYQLDQDFKGESIREFIPIAAFEHLTHTNLALGLVIKGKHCNTPFNYLPKNIVFAPFVTIPTTSWFTQTNPAFDGHWRDALKSKDIHDVLGVPKPRSPKKPRVDEPTEIKAPVAETPWVTVTTILDQDFDGLTLVEDMPRKAYHYLVRTNPSLDMHGSMDKTCDSNFNDLAHIVSPASQITRRTRDWFESNLGCDHQWCELLKEIDVTLIEILVGDE